MEAVGSTAAKDSTAVEGSTVEEDFMEAVASTEAVDFMEVAILEAATEGIGNEFGL
jgi:hypothetical protein